MLRACALTIAGDWETHLDLAEFAYNSSYHASIGMSPFEAYQGHPVRTPVCWGPDAAQIPLPLEMAKEARDTIQQIHGHLIPSGKSSHFLWGNMRFSECHL